MKTRKILPLAIVAVGALIFLSGCDALLDAIFPNDQLSVDVSISHSTYPLDWTQTYVYGNSSGQVTLYLTGNSGSGNTTTSTGSWTSVDSSAVHYTFNFTNLKNDTYLVQAYYASYYGTSALSPGQLVSPHDAPGHSAQVTINF